MAHAIRLSLLNVARIDDYFQTYIMIADRMVAHFSVYSMEYWW